jgi:hypothetical protein
MPFMSEEMTPVLWENLKALAGKAKVEYNTLQYPQKLKADSCERLIKLGYAVWKGDTGPGDSVQIYAITDAGREALAKHEADNKG